VRLPADGSLSSKSELIESPLVCAFRCSGGNLTLPGDVTNEGTNVNLNELRRFSSLNARGALATAGTTQPTGPGTSNLILGLNASPVPSSLQLDTNLLFASLLTFRGPSLVPTNCPANSETAPAPLLSWTAFPKVLP
jgi:hypothetical protein